MRKSILYIGGVFIATICALGIAPERLLRFSLDPGAVQRRMFVLLNPVRDRSPERIADEFLRQLAIGKTQSLVRFYGANREFNVARRGALSAGVLATIESRGP
jgi:hypothetical protein